MDEATRQSAVMTALTTEHFVVQTAASSTIAEASARSSLYMLAVSSSLVAMGFTAQSPEIFFPFALSVLPVVFVLGLFTTMRLVDTSLENMQYLAAIARIRTYYRSLDPQLAEHFAAPTGRWPEATSVPSLRLGSVLAFLGTTASMIAIINNLLAGAGVTLFVTKQLGATSLWLALGSGTLTTLVLTGAFYIYQRWRFATLTLPDVSSPSLHHDT